MKYLLLLLMLPFAVNAQVTTKQVNSLIATALIPINTKNNTQDGSITTITKNDASALIRFTADSAAKNNRLKLLEAKAATEYTPTIVYGGKTVNRDSLIAATADNLNWFYQEYLNMQAKLRADDSTITEMQGEIDQKTADISALTLRIASMEKSKVIIDGVKVQVVNGVLTIPSLTILDTRLQAVEGLVIKIK